MTRQSTPRLLGYFLAVGVAMNGLAFEARGDDAASRDDPVAAAKRRQKMAQSVEVKFGIKEFWPKGSLKYLDDRIAMANAVLPPADATLESVNRLVLDGNRVRFEDNHPTWEVRTGQINRTPRLRVRDDTVSVSFRPTDPGGKSDPRGTIYPPSVVPDLALWTVAPLMMAFRGADEQLSRVVVSNFKPAGAKLMIDGTLCDEFVRDNRRPKEVAWLDPGKDHVIRRIVALNQEGKVGRKCDIQYDRSESGLWVPKSWVHTAFSPNGEVTVALTADVRSVTIGGTRPAEEFDTTLPAGTNLYDGRNRKRFTVTPSGSMVETDARGQPTGVIPVAQPGAGRSSPIVWAVAGFVGVALAVGGWRAWRRRRPRPQTP